MSRCKQCHDIGHYRKPVLNVFTATPECSDDVPRLAKYVLALCACPAGLKLLKTSWRPADYAKIRLG